MKSKKTKAVDIPKAVKDSVWERDGGRCVLCGSFKALPNSHYIRRSAGGLGIEQNIVTMCIVCHNAFDGSGRAHLLPKVESYLRRIYPDWNKDKLVYKK